MGKPTSKKGGGGAGRGGKETATPLSKYVQSIGPMKTVEEAKAFVNSVQAAAEKTESVFSHKVMISDVADTLGEKNLPQFKTKLIQALRSELISLARNDAPGVDRSVRARSEIRDGEANWHAILKR